MRYYSTKTFKLRNDRDGLDYHCSYCGSRADYGVENLDDRSSAYHYFCSCQTANQEKNLSDKIFHHLNEISKLRAKIKAIPINEDMIKAREYEHRLRALNKEYFGGDECST